MAFIKLETSQDEASYVRRFALDGREYVFTFQWNQREEKWYIYLADQDEVAIGSAKVVVDLPLFARIVDERIFPGVLYCVDTEGGARDPGLEDFGTRVNLYYLEDEE